MTDDSYTTDIEHVLLTPREVAVEMKVSTIALARWRRTGSGPKFLKLTRGRSGLIRYRRSDLDEFLSASLRLSTSDTGE